ncbi:hypothetical protein ACIHFC_37820, partial [Streptomyces sp. NPDC052013]|uniref:hypothetical protein n=1 Tax=Streptomyces sp. NPDC052013 TaxID=3365679 RepID=UPI0037D51272
MTKVRKFPYTLAGAAALVAEPTPIEAWAERARIPHRNNPERVLTGAEITRIVGVESKSWSPDLFATLAPAISSARQALDSAGTLPDEIDTFITVSSMPHQPMMDADAMDLASMLELRSDIAPIGLSTGCAGLARAAALLASLDSRKALIVTYNTPSRTTGNGQGGIDDRYLRNDVHPYGRDMWASPTLFSDGAAALVFRRDACASTTGIALYSRDRSSFGHGDASGDPLVLYPGGGALTPLSTDEGRQTAAYGMNGPAVKAYYTQGMMANHHAMLGHMPTYVEQARRIYLHQANPRLVEAFTSAAGLPACKTPCHAHTYGN